MTPETALFVGLAIGTFLGAALMGAVVLLAERMGPK